MLMLLLEGLKFKVEEQALNAVNIFYVKITVTQNCAVSNGNAFWYFELLVLNSHCQSSHLKYFPHLQNGAENFFFKVINALEDWPSFPTGLLGS